MSDFVTASISIYPFLPPPTPKLSSTPKITINKDAFPINEFLWFIKLLNKNIKNKTRKIKFVKCKNVKLLSNHRSGR